MKSNEETITHMELEFFFPWLHDKKFSKISSKCVPSDNCVYQLYVLTALKIFL